MNNKNIREEIVKIWTDPASNRDDINRFMRTFRTLHESLRGSENDSRLLAALKEELDMQVTFRD